MDQFRLDNKVAIITGGAGAIGSETARQLTALGARVFLVDLNISAAGAVAGRLGRTAFAYEADLSKPADCKSMVAACVERFGRLDVLINNVGICPRRSIADSTEEDWERIINVNQKSMFFCSQASIPELRKAKGRIISLSSYAGRAGAAVDACIYSGTKGAIISMTKAMARELAPDILVNAVAPGPIDSELVRGVSPERLKAVSNLIPLQRLARPEEVAASICFLASPTASYFSGATLDVNGGWCMT
jgi:NAD(P)-dependent dehydrogenase (short-subunit alcohol dehydrogenase family)